MLAHFRPRLTYVNIVVTLVLVLALGSGAYAAVQSIPGPDGVIHGCYQKKQGNLRLVRAGKKCSKKERAIAFNQHGPHGVQGPPGFTGPKGAQGIQGPEGPGAVSLIFTRNTADGALVQLAQISGFTISVACVIPNDTNITVSNSSPWAYNIFGQYGIDDVPPFTGFASGAVVAGGAVMNIVAGPTVGSGHFLRKSGELLLTSGTTTEVAVTFTQIDDARGGHPACAVIGQAVPST